MKENYGKKISGRTIAFINKNRKPKKMVVKKNNINPKSLKKNGNQKKPIRLTIMY